MKKHIVGISLFASISAIAVVGVLPVNWTVDWTTPNPSYPYQYTTYIPKTNQAWEVFGTTNLALPMTNWPMLTLLTNWSISPSNAQHFQASISVPYSGQWFFTLKGTNFQGESDFCLPDQTGPVWQPAANLNLLGGK